MPWEVKKNGDKYCVYKIGATTPIKGGCHDTHPEATAQQRALYANYRKELSERTSNFALAFTEAGEFDNDGLLWLEALPAKTWYDPRWGAVPITPDKLERMVKNFNDGVRGQEVTTDYEHGLDPAKGRKASGTYRKLDIRSSDDGTLSLWAGIEPTPTALNEIKDKEWKYFSVEWEDEWAHPETQVVHEDVITGGALTNRPVAKGMLPINFSEVFVEVDTKNEHAPEYFQEPGTGIVDPTINEDDSADTGSRVDTPPAGEDGTVPDRSDTVTNPNDEGGEEMDEAQLVELRKLLGIAEDAPVEDILASAKTMSEELEPLRELRKQTEAKKKFAEEYPEEAERLQRLEKKDQESFAKQFAESFTNARITKKTGEGDEVKDEPTTLGFSAVVLDEIENMAKQFSEGTPTAEQFKAVVDSVLANGIVDYGDKGSDRQPDRDEDDAIVPSAGSQDARKQFGELVEEIMEKDELEFEAALTEAAKRNPKLAEAWRQPPVAA